ncbi:uncharacterized protein LOC123878021 [Maniola jurtina]|uniref:uncharacterized protein LOC123878021 n=1 Tax=Maniola jurtina TaxID=191418 RepID=UPI001E687F2B|nr:uncharacterized protein LOC123878021 [Maniola jurtina]
MAKSAAKIAFYNFKWQFVTIVFFNTTLFCGVNSFLQSYKKNVVVASDSYNPRFTMTTRQFVIFGTNLDNIHHLVTWMKEQMFDSSSKYVIICQSIERKDCDEVVALEYLWQLRIMNVIFINDIFEKGTTGYYYEYGKECKNTLPIKVSNWDSCVSTNESRYCAEIFPVQLRNMHGCPFMVSTFLQPPLMYINDGVPSGADGDLLRIIIDALNATLVLMLPSRGDGWGNLDDNGTWVGSLSDIYYDLANISMTSASITQSRYSTYELSSFYYTSTLIWITHPPEPEPPYYKLLRPFKPPAWIALGFSFLFVVFLAVFLKTQFCLSIWHKINSGHLSDRVIFSAWELCMGQVVTINSMKTIVLYLILCWIWYCFLMRTFYQAYLINSLKTELYSSELSSIEDAIAKGYPFGGGPALKEYYIETPSIYENWEDKHISELGPTLLNLTHGMHYALAIKLAIVQEFLKQPGRKLQILPQKILSSPTGIFLKRYSPFTIVLNRILKRLCEFGFPQTIFKNNTVSHFMGKSADEKKPIKLIHFTGCYIILLIGWVSSFILFIIEMCIEKRRNRVIRFSN